MKKLLFLFLITGFLACDGNKEEEERRAQDDMLIQDYLSDNSEEAQEVDDTGVYYNIEEEGDNINFPAANSVVRVFYKGHLLDGSVFDAAIEGEDDYLEINLLNLVYGWQVAMPKFSKGAKGKIYVPSHAAYGNRPPNARAGFAEIPEYAVLIFEVDVVNVF